jgi:beta-galactosidase
MFTIFLPDERAKLFAGSRRQTHHARMTSAKLFSILSAIVLFAAGLLPAQAATHTFAIGTNDFLLDSVRFQIRCGEIHAARVPQEYWRHRLQMAKAMGLNTVCAYLFWNLHEPKPGEFNWSGQADAAEFCRIAQEEGLWVILRPGPYACAEWEMGGTPWWMLKTDGIKLRSRDPRYLEPAKNYLKEVGHVLAPLQITRGGNIIMVQVENEYGFFGKDANYVNELRKALVDAGFDVPLFQCNPPSVMKNGLLTNLFQAGNFGSDVVNNFAKVRKIQPVGPLICSEFYPGWFDTWGQPHHLGKPENYLPNLKRMLDMGASFSIYMAHGGTTFGLWSGCDRPFKPDTSSYDYDAPISEAGWATPKFFQTRELFSQYLLPGEKLPEPPAQNPVVSFAPVELKEIAPIFENLPPAIKDETPRNMEAYDQGYGCILYRTKIPAGAATTLEAAAIHDFGYVFIDGKRVGILDRRSANAKISLPARETESQFDILVEPMGRINFGAEILDRKGLIAPVKLGGTELKGWRIFNLPLDDKMVGGLKFTAGKTTAPAFWRGEFTLEKAGDTFLDLHNWGKGVVWVNGHCLARFWDIGPTQTAYAPGCWLRAGKNEIVILDYVGPEKPEIAGLEKPVFDELHPEKDFAKSHPHRLILNLGRPQKISGFRYVPRPGADEGRIKDYRVLIGDNLVSPK